MYGLSAGTQKSGRFGEVAIVEIEVAVSEGSTVCFSDTVITK